MVSDKETIMGKLTFEVKRKIIQVAAFGYSNLYLGNFLDGRLYKGKWKSFCNPGMNCYSCPAATMACPIGAMQAVNGSIDFKISFYVWGMILSPGLNYSIKLLQASQNQTIAANIAAQYPEANDLGVSTLIGTGLILFLITFVVNFIARKLTEKATA